MRSCLGEGAGELCPITEAFNWQHELPRATVSSETTAAITESGQLRRIPWRCAVLRYHMGDYFAHWLQMGTHSSASKLPKIFYVNWFRQDKSGKYLWPGLW